MICINTIDDSIVHIMVAFYMTKSIDDAFFRKDFVSPSSVTYSITMGWSFNAPFVFMKIIMSIYAMFLLCSCEMCVCGCFAEEPPPERSIVRCQSQIRCSSNFGARGQNWC